MKRSLRQAAWCCIGSVVAALSLSGGSGSVIAQTHDGVVSPSKQAAEARRDRELARLPLPEAARLAGGWHTREMNVHSWFSAASVGSLARESTLVILAEITGAKPMLSVGQSYISTMHTVRVIESFKGSRQKGESLRVIVPGGRMIFEDGAVAEVRTPGLDPLVTGGRYVLFLERIEEHLRLDRLNESQRQQLVIPEQLGAFVPKLGAQGVFDVSGGRVRAQGRHTDPLKQIHDDERVMGFLATLRRTGSGG